MFMVECLIPSCGIKKYLSLNNLMFNFKTTVLKVSNREKNFKPSMNYSRFYTDTAEKVMINSSRSKIHLKHFH